MVPVAPIITDVTFVFTFHTRCISVVSVYILESSRLVSLSHFCLPGLLRTLISIHVPLQYPGL
jgi:hypothetical protein